MTQTIKMPYDWRVATSADSSALIAMINSAYRGESGRQGWTTESDLLGGQRIDSELLNDLFAKPEARLLVAVPSESSVESPGRIIGCVFIEKVGERCYLGLLTVDVNIQSRGLGSFLMERAEEYACKVWGARSMYMTVISLRRELIAWYEKRGYATTGEKKPFPYDDERFGVPLRTDLEFVVLEKALT